MCLNLNDYDPSGLAGIFFNVTSCFENGRLLLSNCRRNDKKMNRTLIKYNLLVYSIKIFITILNYIDTSNFHFYTTNVYLKLTIFFSLADLWGSSIIEKRFSPIEQVVPLSGTMIPVNSVTLDAWTGLAPHDSSNASTAPSLLPTLATTAPPVVDQALYFHVVKKMAESLVEEVLDGVVQFAR
jgi:hypothetical protein